MQHGGGEANPDEGRNPPNEGRDLIGEGDPSNAQAQYTLNRKCTSITVKWAERFFITRPWLRYCNQPRWEEKP